MSEPIRILQVVTYMGRGGLETMLMNYYRNIDRSKVQFDFLTHRYEKADYDDEIEALGGKIYHLPRLNPFSRSYLSALDSFFKEHSEYQVVHCHQDCLSGVVLKVAKANGVRFTIAHAHSASQDKNLKYLIKVIAKKNIKKYSDQLFACGDEAGKWMFETDDFKVINNAIDTDLYTYNQEKSLEVRRKLGIEGKFVVGHVGRFNYPKNHKFIVDVFDDVCKIESDSVLMLVGDGDMRGEIEDKVKALGLEDKVKFMGVRSDVTELMQAMDVFLFPSLYEGLPVTMVEAQASGLKCIISDKVPTECALTDNVQVVKLEDSPKIWANQVLEYKNYERRNTKQDIEKANFDIKTNAKWLQEFYLNKY
ncbi:MAG: glycosyltransferase family 1 protein [Intestinibacter sp.]|uniref:glycosyltransferase family 1 protein n=1 Tax=Intestinibacter sp. TaxID=1965304 RepID=UPI002A83C210|nr:glycosyltransferase family 1 protein [Intestinibacter sp.]MDY4574172.1 glycosyltransferase family 1 protein [Intestinibacter sp.]